MANPLTPGSRGLIQDRASRPKVVTDPNPGADVYGPPAPGEVDGIVVPPTVTTTWEVFAMALGQSAPLNLRRARQAIRAMPGSGR